MEIQKNQEYIVDVIDNGYAGEGIAKINNFTIFIQGAIKGEKVKILILKVTKSFAYGKILEIIKRSDYRCNVDCTTFNKCGGCTLRHIKYEETLNIKRNIVINCLYKNFHQEVKVNETIGMEKPLHYRNKLQYPVGINNDGNPIIGIYSQRTHNIIATDGACFIQNEKSCDIAQDIFGFSVKHNIKPYDEKNNSGTLRHIIIRAGFKTNEIMVVIVVNNDEFNDENEFVEELTQKYPEIKTIVKNYNEKNTNVILGHKNKVIYGEGYIYDFLGNYKFKISPLSFYQVNPIQTEILYNKAIEYASLTGKETIFDLYCGIGTIGIFASSKAKKVYGIEVVPQAIEDAKENAKLNQVSNAEFFAGEVEKILPDLIDHKCISADVAFIDPPRKGCDIVTIETLLKILPQRIVYVSCNPATLARDIKLLEDKYILHEVQPVDMFPYTSHVECVAVLELKQGI